MRSVAAEASSRKNTWRQLWRIAGLAYPYRYRLALSVLMSVVSVAVVLVLPLGLRQLLDAAVSEGSRSSLDRLALLLLALYLLRAALNFVGPLVLQITGERITLHLRNMLYEHIHSLGIRYFGEQRTGDLLSRLTGDVATIRGAITDVLLSSLLQVFKLVGSVSLMVALNWRLSILIFLVTPLATIASRRYAPKLQRMSREVQDRQADATVIAQEALAGIRLVKAFDRAGFEVDRFRAAFGNLFDMIRRVAVTSTALQVVVDLIFMFAVVVIFWYGGTEVLAHRLTAGDFVAFMFYAQNISQGISDIIRLYTSAHKTAGASERVFELLDTKPDVVDAPAAKSVSGVRGRIQFEGVSFGYRNDQDVLTGLSFSIEPGEHVAIVGLSGAGKTTLLHLLLRFFDPTKGRILLDEDDLRALKVGSLRQTVSLVSQDVYLFSASIADNIRYGRLDASREEVIAAARAAQVDDFVKVLPEGYETRVGENGVKLSGGQRQRIAIARALLKDAPVLLLDEATSSIDASTESSIRGATHVLQRDRTTITITHRLESIRNSPRIIVLDRGSVVGDGTHERLLVNGGVYYDLVESARRIGEHAEAPGSSNGDAVERIMSGF